MDLTTCQAAMTAAVLLFGSFFCLAFAAAVTVSLAAMAAAAVETAAATTAVSGSSYCFSSAVAEMASALAVMDAAAIITVAVAHHGITAVEILAETTVAANLFENGLGGIFGCPSCHENNPAMIETLKLFLPYFPLHIQNLISLYLKFLEFMHTFEMIQNMMNHMDEYQMLFNSMQKMTEGSDLFDEFTYVEEPSGSSWHGS